LVCVVSRPVRLVSRAVLVLSLGRRDGDGPPAARGDVAHAAAAAMAAMIAA
jgi:hypothetical protein